MRDIELARPHSLLAPRLDEFPVPVELDDARVADREAAAGVSVGHEDVAVRRDRRFGRRIKFVRSRSRNTFLSERHQHAPVLIHFEDLMAAVVGDPEVAGIIHRQLVRAHEHARAKRLQQLAGGVELKDRIDGRARAAARRAAGAGIAAAVDDPDRVVGRGRHARRRSPFAAGRQLAEINARLIGVGKIVARAEQRHRGQRHRILPWRKDRLLRSRARLGHRDTTRVRLRSRGAALREDVG